MRKSKQHMSENDRFSRNDLKQTLIFTVLKMTVKEMWFVRIWINRPKKRAIWISRDIENAGAVQTFLFLLSFLSLSLSLFSNTKIYLFRPLDSFHSNCKIQFKKSTTCLCLCRGNRYLICRSKWINTIELIPTNKVCCTVICEIQLL